ncbi:MAG: hypothetical protein JWN04_2655 [Myxococcaceae bacterium]|nr:hypothetical protein [Myxococcaceae bacterium]
MTEVRGVLRRFGAGQSKRQVGRETGMGRNTVDRYVAAAEERGFGAGSGAPSAELVESVVQALQVPTLPGAERTARDVADAARSSRRG